ncbi:hypothetical protein [Tropicibacter naphthalenivorans]|uniref:Putative helicase n=1 Tax=Tropicibacter naphthalenivorans TaxID=441103 RepID=A0A0P1GKA3_9RHOB|nr:hypothetical protein [Tropicibacter naphthalenivorans]CUH82560.1 putative helicase [Tropicibacter naphthalenivorans]SMD11781.1 hypothetical protein SAMN04488093_1282 [Tropicibacter naphthalenivorans]
MDEPETKARETCDALLAELRDDLNGSISEQDAIEVLAQHLITRSVFKALSTGWTCHVFVPPQVLV